MIKSLNVAEKNDAAKNISRLLSGNKTTTREGLSKFNKIYEFNYKSDNINRQIRMTSVSGHLLDLKFPDHVSNWKSCEPLVLFDIEVELFCPQNNMKIKQTLQREAKSADELIIWTDCDREGENIGFEVIKVCKEANARLKIKRAVFSEITFVSVKRALSDLREPNQFASDAVEVRRELDLRIGAAFTRFQTLRFQSAFSELAQSLISYGSCQFPTLGFVVERFLERESFVREPFWFIDMRYSVDKKEAVFKWDRGHIFDHAYSRLMNLKLEALVLKVEEKPKSKWRPVALETVEFEKLASRKLKMKAKDAMKIAEKLYTEGIISYPRTETNCFAKEIDLKSLVEKQTTNSKWGSFAQQLLSIGLLPRNGSKNDGAHPPIHPLKSPERELNNDESKIYELITRHFLACLHRDAKSMETTIKVELSQEFFKATGLRIIERNYLDVYIYENWTDKELPAFTENQRFIPTSLKLHEGTTTPPSLLTEADLIGLMEKHGIGTDATHAEHIETIKHRGYVGLNKENKFVPGKLGMGLVQGYNEMGYELAAPRLRSELEHQLKLISEGKLNKTNVLKDQITLYRNLFVEASNRVSILDCNLSKYLDVDAIITDSIATTFYSNVMKCPNNCSIQCQLVKKKSAWAFECLQCKCISWIPTTVVDIKPSENKCLNCNLTKFMIKLDRSLQFYGMSNELVEICVGCNQDFKAATEFNLQWSNSISSRKRVVKDNKCLCNKVAKTLTTRSGPNKGRKFFKCAHNECNFFQWQTEADVSVNLTSDDPNCLCNEKAVKKIVRKQGPNNGRYFYSCSKSSTDKCSFFKWC